MSGGGQSRTPIQPAWNREMASRCRRRSASRRRNSTGRVGEGGGRNGRAWSSGAGLWIGRHRNGLRGAAAVTRSAIRAASVM